MLLNDPVSKGGELRASLLRVVQQRTIFQSGLRRPNTSELCFKNGALELLSKPLSSVILSNV